MQNNSRLLPLPTTKKEAQKRGWDDLDIILISGDAYIDHPSFGIAVIGRLLENMGLKVAIVPQPNWQDDLRDFKKFGTPRLFFGVSSGSMDSMINHYTANKRLRSNDAYTPGDKHGFRPDYATTVYSSILKSIFPSTPIIIGGIEASLRRFAHYDYWSDTLKPSILIDSKADMLVYGMGEKPIIEITERLLKGEKLEQITNICQTAFIASTDAYRSDNVETQQLYSYEECLKDKICFAKNFRIIEIESNKISSKRLIEENCGYKVIVNPACLPPSENDIDKIYALPYTRQPHFKYNNKGEIPAFEMIKNSINIHRGCFGGCSFCTISAHQGKHIISRSEKSILDEVEKLVSTPYFKGHITDLGGPSANMYKMKGINMKICEVCSKPSCIFPQICSNLDTNHASLNKLYKDVLQINGVKKVTIGSGIRYDLFTDNNNSDEYIKNLISRHVSGRLKVAPEHTQNNVLVNMRKPSFELFKKFKQIFDSTNKKMGLKQQIVPYFISSHPGCNEKDMQQLSNEMKNLYLQPEQVQDFTPTPMTLSTVMFYTGLDPYTLKPIYVAKEKEEKLKQKQFFFWKDRKNTNNYKKNKSKKKY